MVAPNPVVGESPEPVRTWISGPRGEATGDLAIIGSSAARAGIDHIELTIGNRDNGKFWNGDQWQSKWTRFAIPVDRPSATYSRWQYTIAAQDLTTGRYFSRAWTRADDRGIDRGGTTRQYFTWLGAVSSANAESATSTNDNLEMIKAQSARNRNHDDSPYLNTTMSELDTSDESPQLGPRSDYLGVPNGNPSQSFPIPTGGQFRTSCEFSHFAYDDPLIYPNQPGKAHLHMFFGNTETNAFTTYESLRDSGSSTCNGQELNRSGYWVPAMIDGQGNARIPERAIVYYKGSGRANSSNGGPGAKVYEPGMANISPMMNRVAQTSRNDGGVKGTHYEYGCTNNFSAKPFAVSVGSIPNCDGNYYIDNKNARYPVNRVVLEMEIKFWNCYQPEGEVGDWKRWVPSGPGRGSHFYSNCDGSGGNMGGVQNDHYPNITYIVGYVVEPGEDTSDWFLSSDVRLTRGESSFKGERGSTHHGDWWGAWNEEINQEFIDNCVNFSKPQTAVGREPSGCGTGYLSNGGPDNTNPLPGRALKYRPQYDTPGQSSSYKTPLAVLFHQLCKPLGPGHAYNVSDPGTGALCRSH